MSAEPPITAAARRRHWRRWSARRSRRSGGRAPTRRRSRRPCSHRLGGPTIRIRSSDCARTRSGNNAAAPAARTATRETCMAGAFCDLPGGPRLSRGKHARGGRSTAVRPSRAACPFAVRTRRRVRRHHCHRRCRQFGNDRRLMVEHRGAVAALLKPVTVDPATTALLVLDFVEPICTNPHCLADLPAVARTLQAARASHTMVVYSLGGGATAADILPSVAPLGGEPTVVSGPDKFIGTNCSRTSRARGSRRSSSPASRRRARRCTPPVMRRLSV